jgi:hypothetical protein
MLPKRAPGLFFATQASRPAHAVASCGRIADATLVLRGWFEAEPWRTSRELLVRLQAEYPGMYPDGLLRTCQRRLKEWRREAALQLVFGTAPVDTTASIGATCYPVDLPLRLDDAIASPTTPQDLQQQQF